MDRQDSDRGGWQEGPPSGVSGTSGTGEPPPFEPLDWSLAESSLRPPPILPVEIFGDFWSAYVVRTAEATSAPPDYVAVALLTVAAGMIGNSRRASPWVGWEEPCIFWTGLVGAPSSGKTPALKPLLRTVEEIERDMQRDYPDARREWEAEKEAADLKEARWKKEIADAVGKGFAPPNKPPDADPPQRPPMPRLVTNDATVEKIARVLSLQHRGIILHRDELAGWLGLMNKYGGTGDAAFWLESWNGARYIVDRAKYEEPVETPYNSVGIFGGIPPDKLVPLLKGDDDGLAARFLWVWPEPRLPSRPPEGVRVDSGPIEALRRLVELPMLPSDRRGGPAYPVTLSLTREAADALQNWRVEHAAREGGRTGLIASHFGKMPGYVNRLALVLEHLWWSSRPGEAPPSSVSANAIRAAIRMVDDYFKPMAERVFGDAALPTAERDAVAVARWILKERPSIINARELRRVVRIPGLREASAVDAALGVLVEGGWLREAFSRQGPTKGQPKKNYEVNPALWHYR